MGSRRGVYECIVSVVVAASAAALDFVGVACDDDELATNSVLIPSARGEIMPVQPHSFCTTILQVIST